MQTWRAYDFTGLSEVYPFSQIVQPQAEAPLRPALLVA
jgi:hypothetical protein